MPSLSLGLEGGVFTKVVAVEVGVVGDAHLIELALHHLGIVVINVGQDGVGLGIHQLLQLGAEVAGTGLVEHGVHPGQPELLGTLLAHRIAVLADRVVLEQPGELQRLGAGVVGLDEVDEARRLVGEAGNVEDIGADGLQLVGGGVGDPHHLLLVEDLSRRQRRAARIAADRHPDLLDVAQQVGGVHRGLGPALVVLHHQLDRPAEHAARGVHLIGGDLHAFVAVGAGNRAGAGQPDQHADLDRFALLGRGRGGRCKNEGPGDQAGRRQPSRQRPQ